MSPALTAKSSRLTPLLLLALALLCALAFSNVLFNNFIPFDDDIEITVNPHITRMSLESLKWMFTDTTLTQRYTPLSWVVWSLLYHCFGLDPRPFHALTLLVHIANTLLLFLLTLSILRRALPGLASPEKLSVISAIAAACWALHPLRVEVVAWATQVRFAEATAFALLSFLAYFRAVDLSPLAPLRSRYFWFAVAAYVASLLFYPNAIGLPVLLPLLDCYLLKRTSSSAGELPSLLRFFLEKTPFFLPALAIGLITLYGRINAGGIYGHLATTQDFDLLHRIMQAAYIFIYYLWKPFDLLHISPIYTQLVNFNPLEPIFMVSLLAILLLTLAALLLRKRFPNLFLLWAAHLLFIFPVGGYFEHPHYPSDRYAYLQGMLFSVIIGSLLLQGLARISARLTPLVFATAAAILLVCAGLSNLYSRAWTNAEAFFLSIITNLGDDPYRTDIEFRLAKYYAMNRDFDDALEYYDRVIRASPNSSLPLLYKSQALLEVAGLARQQHQPPSVVGDIYQQAGTLIDRAAALSPTPKYFMVAGDTYLAAGDLAAARFRYQTALALDPENTSLRTKLLSATPTTATAP